MHAATPSAQHVKLQPAADTSDLYSVTVPKSDSAEPKPAVVKDSAAAPKTDTLARKDTVKAAATDTVAKKNLSDTTARRDTTTAKTPVKTDTATAAKADTEAIRKRRQRLVRETTINPMNELKGHYRSPKKALFMSLVIPGLGQAYVGQSTLNYVRAAGYLGIDVALGIFWYHYVVVKQDAEVNKYQRFADANWSQSKYEDSIQANENNGSFATQNSFRSTYCEDVVQGGANGGLDLQGCEDPVVQSSGYSHFQNVVNSHDYGNVTPASAQSDSIHAWRANFPNSFSFYELIGKEQEFIAGWKDAQSVTYADSSEVSGTSAMRDQYVAMRATANRYARMQAWFLGGIVVNHIVSALDAALTARAHNMSLYQTETTWYDRLRFNSELGFDGAWPRTTVVATVSF